MDKIDILTMFRSLRNAFITGIVVILPLGVTIILIKFLLVKLNPASQLFFDLILSGETCHL